MLKELIKEISLELGFDSVAFAKFEELKTEVEYLKNWVAKGYNATMQYMSANFEKRENPKYILENCKTIASLGYNYYQNTEKEVLNKAKISKYALGRDYHNVMWEKLAELQRKLKEHDSSVEMYYNVDTGPVMDKVWAVKSGLGWMGKNTNVILPKKGSFFFLATILLNVEVESDDEIENSCGKCTQCLDACPTNALFNAYEIDASKCISFLTIENKDEIPAKFSGKFDNWALGCDICQDVCPWNIKFARETEETQFLNKIIEHRIEKTEFDNLPSSEFKKKFKESPILRAKLKGMQRNLAFLK